MARRRLRSIAARLLAPVCFSVLVLAGSGLAGADDALPVIPDTHIEEALAAAGDNRGELEQVLTHFDAAKHPRRHAAARFLIANMPAHGYVVTHLDDGEGNALAYDPLAFATFKEALAAFEDLEKQHPELEFKRERRVPDVERLDASYLIDHVERAFEAWERTPTHRRVGFAAFLEHVLPYRGSQEPVDDWLGPLLRRYAGQTRGKAAQRDAAAVWKALSKDVGRRVRFDERFYLHPTDQGFTEMGRSGQGRCEDITNMQTYAARSMGLATAADYTPWWAHRDNNHAWTVLLDAHGQGADPAQRHAAKVYRKTFSIQRSSLPFVLPEGHEAPNRFLSSTTSRDVTAQYMETTHVEVALDARAAAHAPVAYLCVFNGGVWKAIAWAQVENGTARFTDCGRDVLYLPATFRDGTLTPAASPLLVRADGTVDHLDGVGAPGHLTAVAVRPQQKSVDTQVVTPVSRLTPGTTYLVQSWADGWHVVRRVIATEAPLALEGLPADGLYWIVPEASRRLERPFTLLEGRQRFW